jgi:hypothetical protein
MAPFVRKGGGGGGRLQTGGERPENNVGDLGGGLN